MKNSLLILFLFVSGQMIGQSVFVSTGSGTLWKTNPNTCASTLVGSCPTFVDLAFLPNGNLYGQTFGGIYRVDTTTAVSTLLFTTASGNSLVGGPNGKLYAVGGSTLYEIDVVANTRTTLGTLACFSGGDLSFFNGELYLSCTTNGLLKIDLTTTPISSTLIGSMLITGAAWGLINTIDSCSDKPFVMSSNGRIYPLNYATAGVGAFCTTSIIGSIYGAASPDEFLNAGPIDLGSDTTLCNGQSIILSVLGRANSEYLWSDSSTNDSLTVSSSGQYSVRVTDTVHLCQFFDTINITVLPGALLDTIITECFVGSYNIPSRVLTSAMAVWVDSNYSPFPSPTSFGSPGSYRFYYIEPGPCPDTAMVTMNVLLDTFDLGNDTLFCDGGTVNYSLNYPTGTFLWNNGSVANNINVDSTGIYGVVMTHLASGCSFSDSVNVGVVKMPDPGENGAITLCDFNTVDLNNSIGGSPQVGGSWLYNGAPVSLPFSISSPPDGNYYYKVANSFCVDSSFVSLTNIVPDLTPFVHTPHAVLAGQTLVSLTNIAVADSIRWFIDGVDFGVSTSFNHKFIKEGYKNVCLVLYNDNCIDTLCKTLNAIGIANLYVPNSFSPNQDGINDMFGPVFAETLSNYQFTIFNRWGEVVFQTTDYSKLWDGKHLNEYVQIGVYSWKISYQLSTDPERIEKFGHVQVIR